MTTSIATLVMFIIGMWAGATSKSWKETGTKLGFMVLAYLAGVLVGYDIWGHK